MSFRDRFFTPRVARAVTSPSGILAAGAGAAVAILVGLGPVGAVLLGAGGWGVRVLLAVPKRDTGPLVQPWTLDAPWRAAVEEIEDSKRRFDEALRDMSSGPLADRLAGVSERLQVAVVEAWRIASAGNTLSRGRQRIDTDRINFDLQTARQAPPTERTAATIGALEAQLASAARLDATIADARDRLRLLDARADETVTRAVEISVSQADTATVAALDGDVSRIVDDLEALRAAIEETAPGHGDAPGTPGGATGAGGVPG